MVRACARDRFVVSCADGSYFFLQVFFSGLRGAVAYACANIFPDNNHNRYISQQSYLHDVRCFAWKGDGRVHNNGDRVDHNIHQGWLHNQDA